MAISPPTGWTLNTLSGNAWTQNTVVPKSGTKAAWCTTGGSTFTNSWLISPALSLNSSKFYRISYWYRGVVSTYEDFNVTAGAGNTPAAQTTIVHKYTSIHSGVYAEGVDTFSVPVSGNYNFGFDCLSSQYSGSILLDSVVIREIVPAPCNGIPFVGTASGPLIAGYNNNFTLSLSGYYVFYTGMEFQWQSSASGQNNFQDIPGATTQNSNIAQNASTDYRCRIRCANTGSVAYSNTITVSMPDAGGLFREKYIGNTTSTSQINGMYFLTAAKGFAAFADKIGYTLDSGHTFSMRTVTGSNTNYNGYSVNLTFGFSPRGIYAFTQDSLLVYGDYGAEPSILFSADNGLNWKLMFHQDYSLDQDFSNSFFDLKFLSSSVGIAINQKYIVETANRGQTWTVKKQIPLSQTSNFSRLALPSSYTSTEAFAVAGNYMYKRQSGTWNQQLPGVPAGTALNFNNVSFVTDLVGYVTNDVNYGLYRTNNGGNNWTLMNDTLQSPVYASDLFFTDDSTGFATTKYTYNVQKTTNRGVTWELCKRNSSYQYANYGMNRLFFLNNQTCWAGGLGEYLMLSTTAGNPTLPHAIFNIDTSALTPSGIVNLRNNSKAYYHFDWYKNGVLFSHNFQPAYTHDPAVLNDTIKLVINNGTDSDSLTLYQAFPVYINTPIINSFTPNTGSEGTVVTISGIGFTGATAVRFGTVAARSFTINSNSSITTVVGGGNTGNLSVTSPAGTGTGHIFTYIPGIPPVITSFSPESGPVGTVVTISGSGFNGSSDSNMVFVGKVKAQILTASATQITCVVQSGSSFNPISVLNSAKHLSGYSVKPFGLTFTGNSSITGNSFRDVLDIQAPYNYYSQQMYPRYITSGDIDGDGKVDLLTSSNRGSDSLMYYRNASFPNTILFDKGVSIASSTSAQIGDMNGDGRPDIVYYNTVTGGMGVLKNTLTAGHISLNPSGNFTPVPGVNEFCISDIDCDGKPDIVMAGYNQSEIGVLRNVSSGPVINFTPVQEFAASGNPIGIAAGDLNGDGKPDVITSGVGNTISVFKNTGTVGNISFNREPDLPGAGEGSKLFIADVDGDGKQDIIISYSTSGTAFSVFRNTGSGGNISFAARADFTAPNNDDADAGIPENFTGDSLPDFFSGNFYYQSFYLHKNVSTAGVVNYPGAIGFGLGVIASMSAADFDGDGKPDLALAFNSNYFGIYKNGIGDPVPISLCPYLPNSTYINSNLTGTSYQWQRDSGSGYINISDGTGYTGTNDYRLGVLNTSSSDYGAKYRCLVDGNFSDVFVIKFEDTWTGGEDNSWENINNWSCFYLPDAFTDVIIPENSNVNVNANVFIRSLLLNRGAHLTVNPLYNLNILH